MHKVVKRFIALLLAAVLAFTPITTRADAELFESVQQFAVAHAMELMDALSIAGFTIAIVDVENNFMWTQGIGYADAATRTPVTEHTLFNIGSTAKLFTAIATMQLVEAGLLDLDEPIVTYLPEFSMLPHPIRGGNYRNITARMLLAHVSGIHELESDGFFGIGGQDRDFMNNWLTLLPMVHMQNAEANRLVYNNSAYVLLSILVARLTGATNYFDGFVSFTQENIFTPAGMHNSSFRVDDSNRGQMASAHIDATTRVPILAYVSATGAGGMVSNAHDMARFMQIMLSGGGNILAPATVEAMRIPQDFGIRFPNDMPNKPMGLGLMYVHHADGVVTLGHGGNLQHHTEMLLCFETGIGVYVSTNSATGAAAATPLANAILRMAVEVKTGAPMPTLEHSITPFVSDNIEDYLGWFTILGELVNCEVEGLHFPDFPILTLTPVGEGMFQSPIGMVWFKEVDGILFKYLNVTLQSERIQVTPAPSGFYEQWAGIYNRIGADGTITPVTVIGVNEQGFAYSSFAGMNFLLQQVEGGIFYVPGHMRLHGNVAQFAMHGDIATLTYGADILVRLDEDEVAAATAVRFVIGEAFITQMGLEIPMAHAPIADPASGRVMVALADAAMIFNTSGLWDEATQTANISIGGEMLAISAVTPLPNNRGMAQVIDGVVFVPLRFVVESFGMQVRWDAEHQAVYLF
ncbi:MAG: serine hydrolase [Defluviitaleaceae bacterium]|nr:serine hydrolase [Defluviitaleaceae bacterium]MCL2273671.1 serine hydrolase [Defluviitaleaceae bacterium]